MLHSINLLAMILNALFANAIAIVVTYVCLTLSDTLALHTCPQLCCFSTLLICLGSAVLSSDTCHMLQTNFWLKKMLFPPLMSFVTAHAAVSFSVISQYFTVIMKLCRFVRHALTFMICQALMWLLPPLFFLIPRYALLLFVSKVLPMISAVCNTSTVSPGGSRTLLIFVIILRLASSVLAGDAASGGGFSIPKFNGTRIKYNGWYTEFCGWIAMKYPDLVDLIEGDWEEPDDPADPNDTNADDTKLYNRYWHAQRQLYGALINAVPIGLRQALAANSKWNGTQSMQLLQDRFGVVDAHDRASALARVSKSYISNGSGISLKDATRQLDRMTEAHTEFTDAGGTAVDDEILKSYFLRAFPSSYNQIKMAIRTLTLDTFDALTEAFLRQVKQAEDDHNDHVNQPALGAVQDQQGQQGQQGQVGRQKGGGRGGGRDGGRGGPVATFITCLRCGVLGHDRRACTQAAVRCLHCMADHLSALCPRGPGGAQREALTAGARALLDADVQRAARQNNQQANNAQPPVDGAAAAQQQMAALMQQMQQMQQQMAALAAPPALPAPPAVDPAHAAQAMQQLYPQNMGASAQQPQNTGLYVLQPVSRASLLSRFFLIGSGLFPLFLHFGTLCAAMTRARGGGGDVVDGDDFSDLTLESNDDSVADDDDLSELSLESNGDNCVELCESGKPQPHYPPMCFHSIDLLDAFIQSPLRMTDDCYPQSPDPDTDVYDCYLAYCQANHRTIFSQVLCECVNYVLSRRWPVERRIFGLPDRDVDELCIDSPDAEIWGKKQLASLEALWRQQICDAIAQSESPSSRQLAVLFAPSATHSQGFDWDASDQREQDSRQPLLCQSRIPPLENGEDFLSPFHWQDGAPIY